MNYLVKNAQGELFKLTVVSGSPILPEGLELVGAESIHNPNNIDLSIAKLELQEIVPAKQVLVSPEVLAVPEVLYQPAVLDVDGNVVTPEIPAQPAIPYQAAVYETIPAVMRLMVVEDTVKSAAKNKEALIAQAYKTMNDEVLAQMVVVFGTTNPDSATANQQTWALMKSKPALFVPSKFATEAEVIAFADAKIAAVEAYAVWREQRIDQFRTYKASL